MYEPIYVSVSISIYIYIYIHAHTPPGPLPATHFGLSGLARGDMVCPPGPATLALVGGRPPDGGTRPLVGYRGLNGRTGWLAVGGQVVSLVSGRGIAPRSAAPPEVDLCTRKWAASGRVTAPPLVRRGVVSCYVPRWVCLFTGRPCCGVFRTPPQGGIGRFLPLLGAGWGARWVW
jgi:hypothetical protein